MIYVNKKKNVTGEKKMGPEKHLSNSQKLRYNPKDLAQYSQIVSYCGITFSVKNVNSYNNGFLRH